MLETMPDKLVAFGKEKGMKAGIALGKKKGMKAGIALGKKKGVKNSIINILEARFCQITNATKQKIETISNIDSLNKLIKDAVLACSVEDFEKLL